MNFPPLTCRPFPRGDKPPHYHGYYPNRPLREPVLQEIKNDAIHPGVQPILKLHDDMTKLESKLRPA